MNAEETKLVKLAIKEAIWQREDIVRYSQRHKDIHTPEDVQECKDQAAALTKILKEMK